MLIKFITKISEDIADLSSVEYSFEKIDASSSVNFTREFLQSMFSKNIYKFAVHDSVFKGCSYINIKLIYNDATERNIKYTNINNLVFVQDVPAVFHNIPTIKVNESSPYANTDENKALIIDTVESMCNSTVENQQDVVRGTKNLVYFTVYGGGYYDLLKLSLQSIDKTTPTKDFDVLIITDAAMKRRIAASSFVNNFNVHYMVVDLPLDGIDASKNKCKIFNWNLINDYNKVLFLDCDIIAVKNLNTIFNRDYESGVLYTVYNSTLTAQAINSPYHSVSKTTPEVIELCNSLNQKPFNAGQFLFINSIKMQQHFANVLWFMNNWPGEYFFEQSFMAQYFCRNFLTKADVIQDDIKIIIIPNNKDINKLHTDANVCIHFAGPPLEHVIKREFITNYCNAYL